MHPLVRMYLVNFQQVIVKRKGWIADGRDIGMRVMPDAEVKFYLTASVDVRAERRMKDYQESDNSKSLEEVKQEIIDRDYQDMNREIDPLTQLPEAIVIDTSDHTIESQVGVMERVVKGVKR